MKRGRDNSIYLEDISREIANIRGFTKGMAKEDFLKSELVRRAVERNIQIIGEAAKGLSEDFRKKNTGIEWRKIIAMRNFITHAYGEVDYEAVWEVVVRDLPELERKLDAIRQV